MTDGFKATTLIPDIGEWKKRTGIELMTAINVQSGEQQRSRKRSFDDGTESYKYWVQYRGYNLEVIESIKGNKSTWRLNLRGSLNKEGTGGLNNINRLTWELLQSELSRIERDLQIPLAGWIIRNLEYGVNIPWSQPVLPFLKESLLMHRKTDLEPIKSDKGKRIGSQSKGTQHQLKAYDKASQLDLPNPLMRIEDSVKRMQYLQGNNITTLDHLRDQSKVYRLVENLLKTWEDLLMFDHTIINIASSTDIQYLKGYSNVKFWIKAAADSLKTFVYHRQKLASLKERYNDTTQLTISKSIQTEWNQCFALGHVLTK